MNRFNVLIKQLDGVEDREMLVNEFRVRDALMVRVRDPIAKE